MVDPSETVTLVLDRLEDFVKKRYGYLVPVGRDLTIDDVVTLQGPSELLVNRTVYRIPWDSTDPYCVKVRGHSLTALDNGWMYFAFPFVLTFEYWKERLKKRFLVRVGPWVEGVLPSPILPVIVSYDRKTSMLIVQGRYQFTCMIRPHLHKDMQALHKWINSLPERQQHIIQDRVYAVIGI